MKNFFYISLLILIFNSCLKEHEIFYPYKNDSLSYSDKLKTDNNYLFFKNNDYVKFTSKVGITIVLYPNSFPAQFDSLVLQWRILSDAGDMVRNRLTMIDKYKSLISSDLIIEFRFLDKKGVDITKEMSIPVDFLIPDKDLTNTGIYRYKTDIWDISKANEDLLDYAYWTINTESGTVNQKGIRFSTINSGLICLGNYADKKISSSELKIILPNRFDVSNSVVQLVSSDKKFNIELSWDVNSKSFFVPGNILLPDKNLNIIVLSEDSDNTPFFGMKYAEVGSNNDIDIELTKIKVEEIIKVLDKL
jgi:hypothetical protein